MCLCLCMYDFENWLASIYYTICFFRIINLPRCACTCSVQFGFISFYVMLCCAVKKQLFHFLTIHKAVLYKRFCGSAHILFYYVMILRIQKTGRKQEKEEEGGEKRM